MNAFYESRNEPMYIGGLTKYPYPLHIHEIVEIAQLLRGQCAMQIGDKRYELRPGDIAFIFPIMPHSYESFSPDSEGFAAFFPADTIAEFSTVFQTLLPEEPVLRREQVPEEVHRVVRRLLESSDESHAPSRLALLHLLLADTLHIMRYHETGTCNERNLANRVMRYVYDHACENITLNSTARELGISVSHLSHLFSQQFKVNFRRFVNAIRIDRAQMLMRDPLMTLTDICYACGYGNIRTFRRAVVSQTGMLPSACLRKTRNETGIVSTATD